MDIVKAATTAAVALSAESAAASDLITKPSIHSVDVTIDRLVSAVEMVGAKVFARVDHAAGAASIGSELRPTQMLMFGNPKLGTPALQLSQSVGLDLPLRVVAYQDAAGQVFLAYHAPSKLSDTHAIPADAEVLTKMTGALDKLTSKAVGE